MNFRNIAIITAIIAFVLGVGYLFFGSLVVSRWQIEPTDSVLLLGRRMGAFYLGLSVIFFICRNLPLSLAQTALSIGAVVILSLLALLGIYEYSLNRVGSGMLSSIILETLLATGYIILLFKQRKIS